MRKIFRLIIVIILIAVAPACHPAIGKYSMWLVAHPQAIVADSHSYTTITAELRDSSGKAVPDGTFVDFTTSLGIIERRVQTTAGIAIARLESGNTTGTALVAAVASDGNAVAQLRVDFLELGTEMFDESFISVSSKKHLGYDSNARIVDSAGGVTIYHRGLTIKAEEAQIDVKTNILRAKAKTGGDNITIERGGKKLEAIALFYDFTAMRGVLITPVNDGMKRLLFRGRDLFTEPDTNPQDSVSFEFNPVTESKLFIKARSLVIKPGEEIKFKRASYYVEGSKLLSVPLQVVKLQGDDTLGTNQMVTYGTEGLRLDFPFYYSLTPNGTGAVRLKHSEPTGWGSYSDRAGWQVDLDQEYNIGGTSQGLFSVNRITSRDWGLQWNQRSEFDNNSQMYTYINYPSHRDIYGTMDYSRPLGDYRWSLDLNGRKMLNYEDRYSVSTGLQSRSRRLVGDAVTYTMSTRLYYDTDSLAGQSRIGNGVGLQFYGKPVTFGPGLSTNTSLSVSRNWGSRAGANVFGNAGITRMLGNIGNMGLNYSYSWAGSSYGRDQRLSANLNLRPSDKWNANLYTTYGLNDHSVSAFGDMGYQFIPKWRIGFLSTLQKTGDGSYYDYEAALSRMLGRQEARLTWSKSTRRFRLEFSAASF